MMTRSTSESEKHPIDSVSRSTWLRTPPVGETDTDRLSRFALMTAYFEQKDDPSKSGFWSGLLQHEVDRIGRETGHWYEIKVSGEAELPPEDVIAVWTQEFEATSAERRRSACESRVRQMRDEDPEILRNVYGMDSAEPFEEETRRAQRRASMMRIDATRMRLQCLQYQSPSGRQRTPRPATTRSQGSHRTTRSSARSGDSGSDGGGEPPGLAEPDTAERLCRACGKSIEHRSAQARDCGSTCTKRFERQRLNEAGLSPEPEIRRSSEHCPHALTRRELEAAIRAALDGYDAIRAIQALKNWRAATEHDVASVKSRVVV